MTVAVSRLTVLSIGPTIKRNRKAYVECACGTRRWVQLQNIRSGATKSCGCLARELRRMPPPPPAAAESSLDRTIASAQRQAVALGHDLAAFEVEDEQAAVTSCIRCDELASIDVTEAPLLFGRVFQATCHEGGE